jgi:hypothetical protein
MAIGRADPSPRPFFLKFQRLLLLGPINIASLSVSAIQFAIIFLQLLLICGQPHDCEYRNGQKVIVDAREHITYCRKKETGPARTKERRTKKAQGHRLLNCVYATRAAQLVAHEKVQPRKQSNHIKENAAESTQATSEILILFVMCRFLSSPYCSI